MWNGVVTYRRVDKRLVFKACAAVLGAFVAASMPTGAAPAAAATPVAEPPPFSALCAVCHGGDAQGTDRAPPLTNNRRLRSRSEAQIADTIKNGRANMPAFASLPPGEIQELAHFVRSLNANAFDMLPAGNPTAGAALFFGAGRCAECHIARGRVGTNGPDLSNIGRQLTLAELDQALADPRARHVEGYAEVDVILRRGTSLHGFARAQTSHGVALQTTDGRLHLLEEGDYRRIVPSGTTLMPAYDGTPQEHGDLIAFLSRLGGTAVGPNLEVQDEVSAADIAAVTDPRPGEWPTYAGRVDGNRHSSLREINTRNVGALRPAWVHPLAYDALETTPIVVDGVMYVTGPNQVLALDARSGAEIWGYSRPRSAPEEISGDAAKGAQRGVAVLGNRVYFITDNAHLICLHKLNGALLWDVSLPGRPGKYGGTSAPLIAGDLVIAGVSGGDEGIRGFVAAYKAVSGEQAWRFWTVPQPGEPAAATWQDNPNPQGGATWTTGSYDAGRGVLYVATGNPYPDTDGDRRGGENLYTDADLALDARTGGLLWYFQFTPHDLHDWDANQPLALVDARFQGRERKLLLHANRNGFLYVLDRNDGKLLQASALVKKLTWAGGIGADGRPILLPNNLTTDGGTETCPAVRGATNWYSTAFNPATQLYYVMTVEDCSTYRKAQDGGYGRVNHPEDPAMKVLRAVRVDSGRIAWEVPLPGQPERNYAGVLSTAGGLVFFGESSGGFAAVDASSGRYLWHYEANQPWKASPITYEVADERGRRQYVAIASGPNILSFALPDH